MSEEEILPKTSDKKQKSYFCKICLENDVEKFINGRYSSCRKCINASKIKSRAEKNKEKAYDALEDIKGVNMLIEKYINTSYVFSGELTIKQMLDKIFDINDELKIFDKKITETKIEYNDIKENVFPYFVNFFSKDLKEFKEQIAYEMNNEIVKLNNENSELRNEINELRDELNEIKSLIKNDKN